MTAKIEEACYVDQIMAAYFANHPKCREKLAAARELFLWARNTLEFDDCPSQGT